MHRGKVGWLKIGADGVPLTWDAVAARLKSIGFWPPEPPASMPTPGAAESMLADIRWAEAFVCRYMGGSMYATMQQWTDEELAGYMAALYDIRLLEVGKRKGNSFDDPDAKWQ